MRFLYKIGNRYLCEILRFFGFFRICEIFNISFRTLYGRIIKTEKIKSVFEKEVLYLFYDGYMYGRIPYDALFADILSARFKLRFYKTHKLSVILEELTDCGNDQSQRYERNVDTAEIDLLADILGFDISDICTFHADNALIRAKLPREIAVSDIYRKDLFRSVLQHTIGKSACGRACIYAYTTLKHG